MDTCVVRPTAELHCWGVLSREPGADSTRGFSNVRDVGMGFSHTCVLLTSGLMQCSGGNWAGQLGDGTYVTSTTPVTVSGLGIVTSFSLGNENTCAVTAGQIAYCWGANGAGQLGVGDFSQSNLPKMVKNLGLLSSLSVGVVACGVLEHGGMKCWGGSGQGHLGNGHLAVHPGDLDPEPLPVSVLNVGPEADADRAFAWAERTEPLVFGPDASLSISSYGFRFRSYSGGHFLGVNELGTPHLFYLGPLSNNALMDLNLLSFWLGIATY